MHFSSRRRRVSLASALLGAAVLTATWTGCGDDDPSRPGERGTGEGEIGPAGGAVETDDDNARVVVPAGALDAPTLIRIRALPSDSIPPALEARRRVTDAYRFAPDGLTFRVPVEVQLFFDTDDLPADVGLEDLTIGKVNAAGVLEELENIRLLPAPSRGRIRLHAVRGIGGTVSSFSPFAVWVDESPGAPDATLSRSGD